MRRSCLAIALLAIWGCGGTSDNGGDNPTPTTTTAPASTTVPPEPECTLATPVSERQPSCYLTLERVLVDLGPRLDIEAQEMVWQGRNFTYVANHCDATEEPFAVTKADLLGYASRSFVAYYGWPTEAEAANNPPKAASYLGFQGHFAVNRRCKGDEGDAWCGRSDVYRPAFEPWHAGWKAVLEANRELDGRSPVHDGIRSWSRQTGRCQ